MMAVLGLRKLLDHAADQTSEVKKVWSLEEMDRRYPSNS